MTIKLKKLLEVDTEEERQLSKGIARLLKQFGFGAAAKDVNASNYKTYAQWILKDLKGKIWLTDPVTRKKTKWQQAEDAYKAFVKSFKALGIPVKESIIPVKSIETHADRRYLLQRKTTGEYYKSGNIHTPETTMKRDEAAVLSGEKIKNIKYNWPMSWDLVDLSDENLGEEVNELHFTGQTLSAVTNDILGFLGKEHKKLGYPDPLDTYHLIQQVMDSNRIIDKVKKIR
jgi:hypothetical protein